MPESNTELMLRAREGDDAAFDRLMLANHAVVLGIIHRYLGGRPSDAEDLAQEVFLKIYRSRLRYEPTARFTTWLYRITANLCLNYRRDRSRQRMPSLDGMEGGPDERRGGIPDAGATAPEEDIDRKEIQRHVREAMAGLPDNQRLALLLAKFQELSYQEIADAMNSTEKAVKSLLHRARTNLKERLEERLGGRF